MGSRLHARVRACVAVAAVALAVPSATARASDPAQVGDWSPVVPYPVVPVSAGLMPDGKLVAWDQADTGPKFFNVPRNGAAMILDPASGSIERSVNLAPSTLFCTLMVSLPDGRLGIVGGGYNTNVGASRKIQVYDEDSRTFATLGELQRPRWYAGGTLDRAGNILVGGGSSAGIERVDQQTGASSLLDDNGLPSNWYPDFIRTPSGQFVIEDIGDNDGKPIGRYLLSGSTLTSIADRTLLANRFRGVRTMIAPYRMLWSSGGTSTASMIIDASSGTPTYTRAAPSRLNHMTGTALTLPDGRALAIGGNSSGSATIGTPVMTPELYDPAADTWTSMADAARQRQYHSVSVLLPDGRVWSAGTSFDDAQEPNGQFFSPPYLFKRDGSGALAPRPTAFDAPARITAGRPFSVATGDPSQIAYGSLIRIAANTHQLNAGQAYVKLPVTVAGGRVQLTAPTVDEAPPGYYMVFLVDRDGVPSVAPIVRLAGERDVVAPTASQSSQLDGQGRASNALAGDGTGSIAHTDSEYQPWWQVDLGESRDLEGVDLTFPSAASSDLWVFASDTPLRSATVDGLRAQAGVTAVRVQSTGAAAVATLRRTARYVRVQLAGVGELSLAEVTFPPRVQTPPAAMITAPATYRAGEPVTLTGAGGDDQDGPLAGSALTWTVVASSGSQTTPVLDTTGASATFTPPADAEDVRYDVTLTARDSTNRTGSTTATVVPERAPLRLASDPAGASFTFASRTVTGGITTTAGFTTTLSAPETLGARPFSAWSDGSTDRTRTVTIPAGGLDLTATYLAPTAAPGTSGPSAAGSDPGPSRSGSGAVAGPSTPALTSTVCKPRLRKQRMTAVACRLRTTAAITGPVTLALSRGKTAFGSVTTTPRGRRLRGRITAGGLTRGSYRLTVSFTAGGQPRILTTVVLVS